MTGPSGVWLEISVSGVGIAAPSLVVTPVSTWPQCLEGWLFRSVLWGQRTKAGLVSVRPPLFTLASLLRPSVLLLAEACDRRHRAPGSVDQRLGLATRHLPGRVAGAGQIPTPALH